MSKHFRLWAIDQQLLLPPSVQDFVPEGHVSRFILGLVRDSLDLGAIGASYTSGLGQPPFDPAMMTALLLNGYVSGLYSSRRIARACIERTDFMMIAAGDPPDFRTIADFRKRHLAALAALFLQVLELCAAAGLAKLGHVAFDGTKIKANASKHKAMSYAHMKKRETELQTEVNRWLAAAETADTEEDAKFGRGKRGDEMPDWVADKQKRIAKIAAAKAALEAEAKAAAEEERRIEAEKQQREAEGRKHPAPALIDGVAPAQLRRGQDCPQSAFGFTNFTPTAFPARHLTVASPNSFFASSCRVNASGIGIPPTDAMRAPSSEISTIMQSTAGAAPPGSAQAWIRVGLRALRRRSSRPVISKRSATSVSMSPGGKGA